MAESLTRKLAAILYADVAGYSRLTGDDEEGTHYRVMDTLDHASRKIGGNGRYRLALSGRCYSGGIRERGRCR